MHGIKNKIRTGIVLMLLIYSVNSQSMPKTSFEFDTFFIQDNHGDYPPYKQDICHLTGDIDFIPTGGNCGVSGQQAYAMDMDLNIQCNESNWLVTMNNSNNQYVAFPFMNHHSYLTTNTQLLHPNGYNEIQQSIVCSIDGTECDITSDGIYNDYCFVADHLSTATGDDLALKLFLSSQKITGGDYFSGNGSLIYPSKYYEPIQNYTGKFGKGSYAQQTLNNIDIIYYFQDNISLSLQDILDINLSNEVYKKDIIINITGEPANLNMSWGEIGLWDCAIVDRTDLYLSGAVIDPWVESPNSVKYQELRYTCHNILGSNTQISRAPVKTDDFGNYMKNIISGCENPQLIYKISAGGYDRIIFDQINIGDYDDPQTVILPWDSIPASDLCFFIKNISSNKLKNYTVDASINDGTYFRVMNGNEDATGFCMSQGRIGDKVKLIIEKSGYKIKTSDYYVWSDSEIWSDIILTSEDDVGLNTQTYNLSGYFLNASNAKVGKVAYQIKCYKFQNLYYSSDEVSWSSDGSYFLNDVAKQWSYCDVSYNVLGYTSGTHSTNVFINSNMVSNVSLVRSGAIGLDRTATVIVKDEFNNRLEGLLVRLTGCGLPVETGTNSYGEAKFWKLDNTCQYTVNIISSGYKPNPYIQLLPDINPFIVTLSRDVDTSYFYVLSQYNGSTIYNVPLTITYGGSVIVNNVKTGSDGKYKFNCDNGKIYTILGVYNDVQKWNNFLCQGEGTIYTLDFYGSSSSEEIDNKIQEFTDFALNTLYPMLILVFLGFAFLVLWKLMNEFLK